ncbi:MAG: hypothetical protein IH585_03575 [Anaerolineaceae bacterium]|nr:hypothetical protein [Anaerolineaceae bacterium]
MTNAIYHQTMLNNKLYQGELSRKSRNHHDEADYSFDEFVQQHPNIPEITAILGKSGEMPILFDLVDPRPGSLLIVNDHLPSIRKLMTVMMKSLVAYSQPTSLQLITISHYPEKWMETIQVFDPQYSYCAGVSGEYENSAEDWIQYLAKKADDRLSGRNHGPAAILFIDDCELISHMNIQARLNYEWLLSNGALSRIWVVSGLDLRKNPDLLHPLSQYKTKIFGHFDSNPSSSKTKLMPAGILEQLQPERNFVTKIGSNWVRFWAPKLQGN